MFAFNFISVAFLLCILFMGIPYIIAEKIYERFKDTENFNKVFSKMVNGETVTDPARKKEIWLKDSKDYAAKRILLVILIWCIASVVILISSFIT